MPKPINVIPCCERLIRSYHRTVTVLNTITIQPAKAGKYYEVNVTGKGSTITQSTYDTLIRIVKQSTNISEITQLDCRNLCLFEMSKDTVAGLAAFVITETRKAIIDDILPTL